MKLLGLVMIIGGIVLGLYVGVWVCLVGGIVQIINELKTPEAIEAGVIAWGIVKIIFSGVLGWGSALLLILPGIALMND